MNRTTRAAILRGVAGAAEAHDAFRFRDQHGDGAAAIDVFGLIQELQIPLGFADLDKLLGACVRVESAGVGILVTTRRDLHMQRFTAAHELGHFVLEHDMSLDSEMGPPGHVVRRDPREIEADAFAAELLMPKWLVRAIAERHGWWADDFLRQPAIVYQLALRMAASYSSTCWTLASHEFVSQDVAEALVGKGDQLKALKHEALDGLELEDSWADVWTLSAADDGARLEAGPTDVFVVELEEPASTGFRWNLEPTLEQGFSLLDDRSTFDRNVVGGAAMRRVVLGAAPPGRYEIRLPLERSFAPGRASRSLSVLVSTSGTRKTGLDGSYAPEIAVH